MSGKLEALRACSRQWGAGFVVGPLPGATSIADASVIAIERLRLMQGGHPLVGKKTA